MEGSAVPLPAERPDPWVVAIDIEATGGDGPVIGIGAVLCDPAGVEVGEPFFRGAYLKGMTYFEERCKRDFWDNQPEALAALEVPLPAALQARVAALTRMRDASRRFGLQRILTEEAIAGAELRMTAAFAVWLIRADEHVRRAGGRLAFIGNAPIFDEGLVNMLILRHLRSAEARDEGYAIPLLPERPTPPHEYTRVYELGSMAATALLYLRLTDSMRGGVTSSMTALRAAIPGLPPCPVPTAEHKAHHPVFDARCMVADWNALRAGARGAAALGVE